MAWTSLSFPERCRHSADHMVAVGPPCPAGLEAESLLGLYALGHTCHTLDSESAHTPGWSHPQAPPAFLWAWLSHPVWVNAGSTRKAYRADRPAGRCAGVGRLAGEPLGSSCRKDPESPCSSPGGVPPSLLLKGRPTRRLSPHLGGRLGAELGHRAASPFMPRP